jgi:hypothetical protein
MRDKTRTPSPLCISEWNKPLGVEDEGYEDNLRLGKHRGKEVYCVQGMIDQTPMLRTKHEYRQHLSHHIQAISTKRSILGDAEIYSADTVAGSN